MILIIVSFSFCLPSLVPAGTKELKVSVIAPYTGPYGFYGEANQPGIELFAELLNSRGGVKIGNDTYQIKLFFIDDEIDPKKGPIAAQEAIRKGVVANVGTYSLCAPISAVLQPAKVLHLGQMQRGYDLKQNKYFIGVNDEWGAPVHHTYATLEMWSDTKVLGFLFYDWQQIQFETMRDAMQKADTPVSNKGIKIVMEVQPMGNMDFTIPLTKFKQAGVNTIICGFGPGDFALLSKQAAALGLKLNYFDIGTATNLDEFIKMAGYENAQGMAFNWPNPLAIKKSKVDSQTLEDARIIEKMYLEKNGKPMSYFGHYDWSTEHLKVLIELYKLADSINPDDVMKVASGGTVKDFQGTWTLGGEKTWGAPVVKGSACVVGKIQGNQTVYGAEFPMPTIP
jgi:ABC-type branched-subunit amino acid transport system substrate-binding protein